MRGPATSDKSRYARVQESVALQQDRYVYIGFGERRLVATRWLLAGLLAFATASHAADRMVLGRMFVLKSASPTDGTRRKLVAKAKERPSANTIVGDPTVDGAELMIAVEGGTASSATFPLMPGRSIRTGRAFWTGDATHGFRYTDPVGEMGPVRSLRVKAGSAFQIKLLLDGRGGPIPLAPPDPGSSGCFLLTIHGGDAYNVNFADGAFDNVGAQLFRISKPLTEGMCSAEATSTASTTTTTSTTRTTTTVATTSTTRTTTTVATTSTTRTTTTVGTTSTTRTTTTVATTSTTRATTTVSTTSTTRTTTTATTTSTTKTTTTTATTSTTRTTTTTSTTSTTKTTTTSTTSTTKTTTTTATTSTTKTTTTTSTTSTTKTTTTSTTSTTKTTTTTRTTTTATTIPAETPNAVTFGSTGSDDAVAVATDASGNEIVCGTIRGRMTVQGVTVSPNGTSDAFLAKVAPNGTLLWLHNYGGSSDDSCLTVTVDPAGDIVAGGQFTGAGTVGGATFTNHGGIDLWIGKFSGATGAHVWSAGFGGASSDAVNAVRTDANGNVWATGFFQGSINFGGATLSTAGVGDLDCFLLKLAGTGGHLFSTNFPGGTGQCEGNALAVDTSGNVHLAGHFTNNQGFGGATLSSLNTKYDAFVAKFSSAGAHVWSLRFGNANADDAADGVAVDAAGDVFVVGYVTGDVDFGGGSNTSFGSQDGYVLKLTSGGAFRAVQRIGEVGDDYVSGVAVDASSNVIVGGSFEGTAAFGGTTTLVADGRDGFLAKYTNALVGTSWKVKQFTGSGTEWTNGVAVSPSGFDIGVGYSSSASMTLDGVSKTNVGQVDGWAARVAP